MSTEKVQYSSALLLMESDKGQTVLILLFMTVSHIKGKRSLYKPCIPFKGDLSFNIHFQLFWAFRWVFKYESKTFPALCTP